MKVRLTGLQDELDAAVTVLGTVLQVDEVSRPYPRRNSSRLVSLYLEARLPEPVRGSGTDDDKNARDADAGKQ
ncbi:hypothetical protein [Actinomadura rupiterrae]|uniref:hypothetical protein n=1 Tax=Actinomadura rupiterrae TaxID=559627 RepID=UPI0020A284B4|nr:hypothetical protein [Actinomadura rupiterrae]MCP2340180.1 hypothetical protein [Actinomadura rupiterrae]